MPPQPGPMDTLLHYWPLIAFMSGLFFSGLTVAVGLTFWVMGQIAAQTAARIEVKEAVLAEMRLAYLKLETVIDANTLHAEARLDNAERNIEAKFDTLAENVINLGNRIVALETKSTATDGRLGRVERILNGSLDRKHT